VAAEHVLRVSPPRRARWSAESRAVCLFLPGANGEFPRYFATFFENGRHRIRVRQARYSFKHAHFVRRDHLNTRNIQQRRNGYLRAVCSIGRFCRRWAVFTYQNTYAMTAKKPDEYHADNAQGVTRVFKGDGHRQHPGAQTSF